MVAFSEGSAVVGHSVGRAAFVQLLLQEKSAKNIGVRDTVHGSCLWVQLLVVVVAHGEVA